jgi:hypothetical protein
MTATECSFGVVRSGYSRPELITIRRTLFAEMWSWSTISFGLAPVWNSSTTCSLISEGRRPFLPGRCTPPLRSSVFSGLTVVPACSAASLSVMPATYAVMPASTCLCPSA